MKNTKENTKTIKKFKHFTLEERKCIARLYNTKDRGTLREIGKSMGRSHSSIRTEINLGLFEDTYEPELADDLSKKLRKQSKEKLLKVILDGKLRKIVEAKIRKKVSPERISGELKKKGIIVSAKAIYKFVKNYHLERFLRFKGKPPTKKGSYSYRKAKELDKKRIKDRPSVSGVYGHYEMDFIVSSQSTYTLLVIVEKLTRKVYIKKIENRTHAVVTAALKELLGDKKILSITTDNDIAFSNWREIEEVLHTTIYFCEPYHSWEKGQVENTNCWIRQFVKKKSDIADVTEEKIVEILDWFNDEPRKVIGFCTANELDLGHRKLLEHSWID